MNRSSMCLAIVVLIVALGVAAPATADTVVINNGLAPPNPENVLDSYFGDVEVHNVGCDATPCPMPWGDSTSVELVEWGLVQELSAYESSTIVMTGGEVYYLTASESSNVAMSGGSVIRYFGQASGGYYGGWVFASGSSNVAISSGSLWDLGVASRRVGHRVLRIRLWGARPLSAE